MTPQRRPLLFVSRGGEQMYRALYRKWRPQRFEDVVGQQAVVAALKNQIAAGRVGHAYLFTGVRGTGKTTCAKIFARAVNCLSPEDGNPCGRCDICRGLENGSIMDIVEMDAASNNSVDDIRDLRDETVYTPSVCRYKVYIIDEVHMLSSQAFNALLKTLEEPPSHIIFILATTEIQKVPATILSRCQRYDFTRIGAEDIARRTAYIAAEENLALTDGAAALIARLADGALRDALSILDTCAGVTEQIDEEVVRRMAGVTDRSYLFRISDAISSQDGVAALAELAALRQQSVDVKRLTEELISHYRNLMLAALPGGRELLTGASPDEEELYLEKGPRLGQREAIRAIRTLGTALEHMARGSDQRIELELALFSLAEPEPVPTVQNYVRTAPQQAASAQQTVRPFASASAPAAAQAAPAVQQGGTQAVQPAAKQPAVQTTEQEEMPELPWDTQPEPAVVQPVTTAVSAPAKDAAPVYAADPVPTGPRRVASAGINPYPQWGEVVKLLEADKMLYNYLKNSKAYFDGKHVLIDAGSTFRDFIRSNKPSQQAIKRAIKQVSGIAVPIGPYVPEQEKAIVSNAEDSLRALEQRGLEVVIQDREEKPRRR